MDEQVGRQEETVYPVGEAARVAGLAGHEHVIYRLVDAGEIRGMKVGGVIRVPGSEVERLKDLLEEERTGVSVEEAARDLRIGLSTARRWMREGVMPSRRRRLGKGRGFFSPRCEYRRWRREMLEP